MERRGIDSKIEDAKETIDALSEISHLLNCGLDKESLSIIVSLIELGINPDALAAAVKELQRESAAVKATQNI
jgi:mitotic-spindle organizing protein 1